MKTTEEKQKEYAEKFNLYLEGMRVYPPLRDAFISGYNEAMRWRDPKTEPPINQDVVLVKTDNNCYATAYYHGDASGFITYGEDAYVEFGEIIGWRPIE